MNKFWKRVIKVITSRLFTMCIVILGMFGLLVIRLFNLQIVLGEEYESKLNVSVLQPLSIPAPRGIILDRYGRPLAVNKVAYTVKIDDSIKVDDRNRMLLDMIAVFEENGDKLIDDLPMTMAKPFTHTFSSERAEKRWKEDMGIPEDKMDMNGEETFVYFRNFFQIDPDLSDHDARKLISLRCKLYLQRYQKYKPITVAVDVADRTVAVLEERHENFPGVYIEAEALRYYPEGSLFAHILGYIRGISNEEYEVYKEHGYTPTDIIGKTGIEKAMELELKGTDGQMLVEVDSMGRRINVLETNPAIPGNKVFLTIDKKLQQAAEEALVNTLEDIIINRLEPKTEKDKSISLKQVFMGLVSNNFISLEKLQNSSDGEVQNTILKEIETAVGSFDIEEGKDLLKQTFSDLVQAGTISPRQMILCMLEQGLITGDEILKQQLEMGVISPMEIVKQKIKNGEITPQNIALDPSTGSVVVIDVHSGETLALVSYPSYDNNEFVNNFNYEYYKGLEEDRTAPLINRAVKERKAPGSTFKMITALAGLEEGVITPTELIYDYGSFTKAGAPAARCWIHVDGHGSHGLTNVSRALEVSCNYFFYETAYRLGNTSSGTRLQGIEALNKYMSAFGLDSFTGIEIEEYRPQMSSAENKERFTLLVNPDATQSQTRWLDGDTIRTAIGQSYNNFAPVHLAKYIATLANGGTEYKLHLVDKIEQYDGTLEMNNEPSIENQLSFKPENLNAVYQGMLGVTAGAEGTARRVFENFPVKVAGKTGTAQEGSRDAHAWFVGFAPYENPQIAVVVMIPYGDSSNYSAEVAKNVISAYMGLNEGYEKASMDNLLAR